MWDSTFPARTIEPPIASCNLPLCVRHSMDKTLFGDNRLNAMSGIFGRDPTEHHHT